jgi:hypothetical protein
MSLCCCHTYGRLAGAAKQEASLSDFLLVNLPDHENADGKYLLEDERQLRTALRNCSVGFVKLLCYLI